MTWQLYAYGLLGLVLVSGFAWYELSRPPARMVALVAALAALAVAGRLAFAAVPNVVATTDIVLITGFSVGAAPGFAVGALAAVVSNLWLGEGPWTPWQMAGWGLVGIGGAWLAVLTRGRLGRLGLAVACGLAGLAYGALLDLSVMVSYGGEQSLDRYLAISARGVPFNVAHAVGNFALALAAGPALVRMISRYRARFTFRWRPAGAASIALLLATAVALVPAPARAGGGGHSSVSWLARAQGSDGGFGPSPGTASSTTMTGWVALGLEAAGRSPFGVKKDGRSVIAYLRANVSELGSIGDLERTILALEGADVDSHGFAGRDLVAELRRRESRAGSFDGQVNLTAFGILALRSAGAPRSAVARSARWLRRAENRDGGWGFQPRASSDPDSTGAALQGLAAAGPSRRPMRRGAAYLRHAQARDGGFAIAGGGASNAQSTAWAVQGLVAARVNPASIRRHGRSPMDYLAARQRRDGHYEYSASSDQTPVWVTGQALVAAKREAFPLPAVARPVRSAKSSDEQPGSQGSPSPDEGAGTGSSAAVGAGSAAAGTPPAAGGSEGSADEARRVDNRHGGGGDSSEPSPQGGPDADPTPLSATTDDQPAPAPAPDSGDSHTALYVTAALAALAAALAAGFVWYRRRLP